MENICRTCSNIIKDTAKKLVFECGVKNETGDPWTMRKTPAYLYYQCKGAFIDEFLRVPMTCEKLLRQLRLCIPKEFSDEIHIEFNIRKNVEHITNDCWVSSDGCNEFAGC